LRTRSLLGVASSALNPEKDTGEGYFFEEVQQVNDEREKLHYL
jgi:hypothetical protein